MKIYRSFFATLVLSFGSSALADVPKVATDIPPIHGLVAQVMQGVGEPALIVRPGASPHGYAMRPSEAAALESAQIVFWVGHALTPWLEGPVEVLAGGATVVELLEHPSTFTLSVREGVAFGEHDHDHGDSVDDHAEDAEHDEEGHDNDAHEVHDDHDSHDDHGGHEAGSIDPHAWLDPENGKAWLGVIAETLAIADPENAEAYYENARSGIEMIDATALQISEMLAQETNAGFFVYHDAYHYFEHRFEFEGTGAISLTDGTDASPARLSALRDLATQGAVVCVFSEVQFAPGLVTAIADGQDIQSVVLDPLGTNLSSEGGFYSNLLLDVAQKMTNCL